MIRTLERYALSSFDVLGSLPEEIATEILKEFEVKELLELGLVSRSRFDVPIETRSDLSPLPFLSPRHRSRRDGELSFRIRIFGDTIH